MWIIHTVDWLLHKKPLSESGLVWDHWSTVTLPQESKLLPSHVTILRRDSSPVQISTCSSSLVQMIKSCLGEGGYSMPVIMYPTPCCPWGNILRGHTHHWYVCQNGVGELFLNLVGIVFSHLMNHIRTSVPFWLLVMNESPNLSPTFLTILAFQWLHLCFHNQKGKSSRQGVP